MTYHALDHRIVAEIQRKIVKWGKRNAISRLLPKNDEKTIATWRLELTRILQVFNVRLVHFFMTIVNSPLQTELATNARTTVSDVANTHHGIVSDTHRDSSNANTTVHNVHHDTQAIVSEVRNDVANTRTTISDTHRNTLKPREDKDGRGQAVSTIRTLPVTE